MSKTVLTGVLGGVTLVTGLLFYGIYLRDKEQNITLEEDEEKEKEKEKEKEPVVSKKRSTTSRNFQNKRSNTKRNRS